jgi:hypothetical protein
MVQQNQKNMTKYRNRFLETEASCLDLDESSDSSEDFVDEYNYNDGFLVPDDDEIDEEHTPLKSLEDEIQFEKMRADAALDELYMLRKRLKTFKRRLKTMSKEKKACERRAKRSKLTHT